MPRARVNGIQIAYEDEGAESAPTILLIHGLGMPLTGWPHSWRQHLVNQGFRVISLDNRDAGQSEQLDHLGLPSLLDIARASLLRQRIPSPYSLQDMAADALAVLDHLAVHKVHVIGASMGGMISQHLAIHAPARIKSLTAIMTMSGNRTLPQPALKVQWLMLTKPRHGDRQALISHSEKLWRAIGSPAYPPSETQLRNHINGLLDRGLHPAGAMRQLAAILAEDDRSALLRQLDLPTLVIHGADDPLLHVRCGRQLAEQIPGAHLHIEPGMGHDLPEALDSTLLPLISAHIKAAEPQP